MNNKFVLCVGAQKSGTTWLHSYLSRRPGFDMGLMKEYHVWDALSIGECRNFLLTSFLDVFDRKGLIPRMSRKKYLRYRMQNEVGFYENYFSGLMNAHVSATGDITPSYSGLSSEVYRTIKERLESCGFELKIVFLMRDPLERCWSAVRMERRKLGLEETESELLKERYSTPDYVFRTDYRRTVEALESGFDGRQIYYGFYEDMFERERVIELSSFLGVEPDCAFSANKFNVSAKTSSIPDGLRAEVIDFYRDVYDYCHGRFPQTRSLWPR
jgi:hypothetical protein